MTRVSLHALLAAILVAFPAAAQESADLSVISFRGDATIGGDKPFGLEFIVTNNGPAAAHDVTLTATLPTNLPQVYIVGLDGFSCTREGMCTVATLAPSATVRAHVGGRSGSETRLLAIAAEVTSATPDPNAANNHAQATVSIVSHPQLSTFVSISGGQVPGSRGTITTSFFNRGSGVAHNVRLTLTVPEGTVIAGYTTTDPRMTCDVAARPVVCSSDALAPMTAPGLLRFDVYAPHDAQPGFAPVTTQIETPDAEDDSSDNTATAQWSFARVYAVTTTADDGAGSLRQTILDVNAADCANSCLVAFTIPEPLPPSGFFTIQPRSPLPGLTAARVAVLGAAEADWLRITTTKPLVMIDGSLQPSGDGLRFTGSASIGGVAVGNFPDAGIRGGRLFVSDCYVGVDPTGAGAAPNMRGIVGSLVVARSVISGNLRTGLFGVGQLDVRSCRIGVAAGDDTPIPNGATGIFASWGCDVLVAYDNVVANNGEWGIATLPNVRVFDAERNLVYDNGTFNLDPAMGRGTTRLADDTGGIPNPPVLLGARYDADRGKTVVTFQLTNAPFDRFSRFVVTVFSANGPVIEARKLAGSFDKRQSPAQYEVEIAGDWRGSFFTAQVRRGQYLGEGTIEPYELNVTTSALSDPIRVD